MNGNELNFEAEPFELEEESFARRPGAAFRPPPRGPWKRPLPHPRRPLWGWAALPPSGPAGAPAPECETVLVLEGFPAGQTGLAAHHGPMLQRLASAIGTLPQRPQSIEVDGRSAAGRPDRRAEAAARFLKTRFRNLSVTTLFTPTQGPERVEIRLCFSAQE